jgi:phosphatidylglycerol---prolipoprotein diacylglyceryl transferase
VIYTWLHTTLPQPGLVSIGQFTIRWYGLCLAMALLAGVVLAQRFAVKRNLKSSQVIDLAVWVTIAAIIGARLVHVIETWGYYRYHLVEIIAIWRGGLAFHGVVIGGVLALLWFSRRNKISALALLDIATPALVLGQVIGRWGNWFNQELYGSPSTLPWSIPIEWKNRLSGYELYVTFHPLFLYESLGNALILILLLVIWRRKPRVGVVTGLYFVLSPLLRFFLDYLRLQQPMMGPFTDAQVLSILLIIFGLGILWFSYRSKKIYVSTK